MRLKIDRKTTVATQIQTQHETEAMIHDKHFSGDLSIHIEEFSNRKASSSAVLLLFSRFRFE